VLSSVLETACKTSYYYFFIFLLQAFLDDQDEDSSDAFPKKTKLTTTIADQPPSQAPQQQIQTPAVSQRPLTPQSTPTSSTNKDNRPLLINKTPVNTEEKRQAVRKLIESIPTKKEDLFTFSLDWSLLDAVSYFVCMFQIIFE